MLLLPMPQTQEHWLMTRMFPNCTSIRTSLVTASVVQSFAFMKSNADDTVKWQKGDKTPFAALTKTFEAIEDTTKRCALFRSVCSADGKAVDFGVADQVFRARH
jgi:hypothetical protein